MSKFDLLIVDEPGYLPVNMQGNYNLFQLINAPYEYRSIFLTTNKDFTSWGEFFVDENVAVPIVDRLIHYSHIFILGGGQSKCPLIVAASSASGVMANTDN